MAIAKSKEDLPTLAQTLSMSGLEFMQKVLKGEISGPPISDGLNYKGHTIEAGRMVFRGTPLFSHSNPMGSVHGGWYGTVLDSCMACAVMSMLPKGTVYTTLEYKINITRAIPVDMEVEAIGTIQHIGRTTGVANGEIRGLEDSKLYATGSTTCLIMTPG